MKVTLDTNCIINLFDQDAKTATSLEHLELLFRTALSGQIELAITTRVREDLENDSNENRRRALLRNCRLLPVIGSVFRFDVSRWGSGDLWASREDIVVIKSLQELIFPNISETQSNYKNKIHDIDHLFAHSKAGRNIFVTDDKGILKRRLALKSNFGIIAMSPKDVAADLQPFREGASVV